MAKADLAAARNAKQDEFYTQLDDIAKELKYYKQHFKDKVVLCNCDDPYESNFFKYFALNFNQLGLKKLIATCYDGSPIAGDELPLLFEIEDTEPKKIAYKVEISEVADYNNDGAVNMADVQWLIQNNKNVLSLLKGNGDFRSAECVELLKEADIVVTNPPFSLFREYVSQLIDFQKKFLIIGNMNAVAYKEIFPLIRKNLLWLGVTRHGTGSMWFRIPQNFPEKSGQRVENGIRYQTIGSTAWFTNLDHSLRHEEIILYKQYSQEEYPTYDNYDAINVDRVTEIPIDYEGVMGVPITFLGSYNPDQFEILDINPHFFTMVEQGLPKPRQLTLHNVGQKDPYARILIRNKKPQKP